jgi:hypothetical protein
MRTDFAPAADSLPLGCHCSCVISAWPEQTETSDTCFLPAVPFTEKTAYTVVLVIVVEPCTGLFAADDPVNEIDPSGNDYGDFDINMRSIGNLLSTIGAVETAETGLGVFSPERTVTVQSFIAAPYVVGPVGLFAGDNHGPTPHPSSHFRTTSTESFYDYLAGTGSVKSDTGTTIELSPFIPGGVMTGKASSAGLTGSETYISSGISRITMDGSASNPLVPGAPPIQYHLMLSINFNTDSFAGSFTRTDFPSFQIFIDDENIYNYKEVGNALNLRHHYMDFLSGTFKP